jgi:glycosyltransferase involved in cell wall biosynthesis
MPASKGKINLLFVLIQISTGGTEKIVLDLARKLDRGSFNLYVAFFAPGALEAAFKEVFTDLFCIHKKAGQDLGAMLQLYRIIREKHIHVINAHHYMPFFYSFLGSKILSNRRLIYTEHSAAEVGLISGAHRYYCDLMLRRTDRVVGVSNQIAEAFRARFPSHSGKILSIQNGVDIEQFSQTGVRNQIRTEWGLLPDHFVIGTVANFRKVKNHACLIRGFHRLNTQFPQTRLVLVGRSYPGDPENSENDVRALVRAFGLERRVVFAGYRDDVPGLLKSFDVFCLPSFSEGLPVSALEAMAAGVPVVGSEVTGLTEIISPGVTGLLFPCDDSESLFRALEVLVNTPETSATIRERAYAYVCRNHAVRKWVDTYDRLFNMT